jgi:transposase InsO family protein
MTQIQNIQIPKAYRRTVRRRQAVLEYAARHSVRSTARHFTLDPKTVRAWRTRHQRGGLTGLVPRYPARRPRRIPEVQVELVAYARRTLQYGATRTQLWLVRVHQVRLAQATIQRIFRDLGLPRLCRTKKRAPKQLTLFEKPHPGDSIQIDTKVVKLGGVKVYQYTALDDCTRLRVLRLYQRLHVSSSLRFLTEVCRGFPFPIRTLQCDNGAEFPFAFSLAVQERGIRHRYIRPRRPQQNGKVERSHRVDQEEFWERQGFPDFETAAAALPHWERTYNYDRFSLALQGRTPAEKLAALTAAA